MENKKQPGPHLRLVKTPEADTSPGEDKAEPKKFRSAFASSLNQFADELDQFIEAVHAS